MPSVVQFMRNFILIGLTPNFLGMLVKDFPCWIRWGLDAFITVRQINHFALMGTLSRQFQYGSGKFEQINCRLNLFFPTTRLKEFDLFLV